MSITDKQGQNSNIQLNHSAKTSSTSVVHRWPLLGTGLFALEQGHPAPHQVPTEQEKRQRRQIIHHTIIAQMKRDETACSRDVRYLAFLLLKQGRAGVIVGNPYAVQEDGSRQELPYTGLEGYYAGSQGTATRPGITPEAILQEEADLGAHLLKTIKQEAIEQNTWARFAHLKHVLEGALADQADLRMLQRCFGMVVGQLHARVYHNPEFVLTLSEHIEQLEQQLSSIRGNGMAEQRLRQVVRAECKQLKALFQQMSPQERERERQERSTRERIRAERLEAFTTFRDETYQILAAFQQACYLIGICDSSPSKAAIIESVNMPVVADRSEYAPVSVRLTPAQIEGYLFLAELGEIGGDPLVRDMYR
jgi:hypothetical protein